MFKREVLHITAENHCRVIEVTKSGSNAAAEEVPVRKDPGTGSPERRGELFVLAANIYFRARRNTRARAAGIL